jgi:hypothetical protein
MGHSSGVNGSDRDIRSGVTAADHEHVLPAEYGR